MSGPHLVRGQRVRPVKVQASRDLRHEMTGAERVLWDRVRGGQIRGLRFRRQQVIAGFIVDFYCHAARLVVEIDGDAHMGQADYDAARDTALAQMNLQVMRFSNIAVLTQLANVLTEITIYCQQAQAEVGATDRTDP